MIKNFIRNIWLYWSADLTLSEIINILINKIIYFGFYSYFSIKGLLFAGDKNVLPDYKKDLPHNLHPKKALLIFFRFPIYKKHFIGKMKFYFSNNGLVINIVRALNELGYIVDIIDSDNCQYNSHKKYDLMVVHNVYDQKIITNNLKDNGKYIYFDTGVYWRIRKEKIKQRYEYFFQRHDINVKNKLTQQIEEIENMGEKVDPLLSYANGIITIGDKLIKTYTSFPNVYYTINGVYIDKYFNYSKTINDIDKGKKNFLFFSGGFRNIEKGLDLLLEIFTKNSDYNLFICSQISPELQKIYDLKKYQNIHLIGYLKQRSKKFYEIIKQCNYVIQPSAHEGMPGGVLDCMQYGLIPIVTPECNVDTKNFGFILNSFQVEDIDINIKKIISETNEKLLYRSKLSREEILKNYTEQIFLSDIKKHIKSIINKNL